MLVRRRVIVIFGIALLSLIVLEVWAVNRLSAYGEQLSKIDLSLSRFNLENSILKNEIAARSSLKEQEKISKNLGFEHISKIEYLGK